LLLALSDPPEYSTAAMKRFLTFALLFACGPAPDLGESTDEATSPGPNTVSIDVAPGTTSQVRLRADVHTVWVDPLVALDNGSWRMFGRTSRNLQEAVPFIQDDGFASASIVSARRFELRLDRGHEINTMLSGLPLFVQLRTSSNHALGLWFGARFSNFSGNRGLFLEDTLVPVYRHDPNDTLRYRAMIELDRTGCQVTAPGAAITALDADSFAADFTFTDLAALAAGARVEFNATCGSTTLRKSAAIQFGLLQAGLTIHAAEVEWPSRICPADVGDCVEALDPTTVDLATCGRYREVAACILDRNLGN
jgi:hypothetical protein